MTDTRFVDLKTGDFEPVSIPLGAVHVSETSSVRTNFYPELTFVTNTEEEEYITLKRDTYTGGIPTGSFMVNPDKWKELDVEECIREYPSYKMFQPAGDSVFIGSSDDGRYMQFDAQIVDWHGRIVAPAGAGHIAIINTVLGPVTYYSEFCFRISDNNNWAEELYAGCFVNEDAYTMLHADMNKELKSEPDTVQCYAAPHHVFIGGVVLGRFTPEMGFIQRLEHYPVETAGSFYWQLKQGGAEVVTASGHKIFPNPTWFLYSLKYVLSGHVVPEIPKQPTTSTVNRASVLDALIYTKSSIFSSPHKNIVAMPNNEHSPLFMLPYGSEFTPGVQLYHGFGMGQVIDFARHFTQDSRTATVHCTHTGEDVEFRVAELIYEFCVLQIDYPGVLSQVLTGPLSKISGLEHGLENIHSISEHISGWTPAVIGRDVLPMTTYISQKFEGSNMDAAHKFVEDVVLNVVIPGLREFSGNFVAYRGDGNTSWSHNTSTVSVSANPVIAQDYVSMRGGEMRLVVIDDTLSVLPTIFSSSLMQEFTVFDHHHGVDVLKTACKANTAVDFKQHDIVRLTSRTDVPELHACVVFGCPIMNLRHHHTLQDDVEYLKECGFDMSDTRPLFYNDIEEYVPETINPARQRPLPRYWCVWPPAPKWKDVRSPEGFKPYSLTQVGTGDRPIVVYGTMSLPHARYILGGYFVDPTIPRAWLSDAAIVPPHTPPAAYVCCGDTCSF